MLRLSDEQLESNWNLYSKASMAHGPWHSLWQKDAETHDPATLATSFHSPPEDSCHTQAGYSRIQKYPLHVLQLFRSIQDVQWNCLVQPAPIRSLKRKHLSALATTASSVPACDVSCHLLACCTLDAQLKHSSHKHIGRWNMLLCESACWCQHFGAKCVSWVCVEPTWATCRAFQWEVWQHSISHREELKIFISSFLFFALTVNAIIRNRTQCCINHAFVQAKRCPSPTHHCCFR